MEVFLDAFFSIDTDNNEEITVDDLKFYMNKNNFEDDFVKKWLEIFDKDGNGIITLDEFCRALGLLPKKARLYKKESFGLKSSPRRKLPSDVEVISADMSLEMQLQLIDMLKEGITKPGSERDIARLMKQELDARLGRLWHVAIVIGQYWLFYSHEPECSFHFKYGRHICLIWRTPGY